MQTCPWSCVVRDLDGTLLVRGGVTPVEGIEAGPGVVGKDAVVAEALLGAGVSPVPS